MRLIDADDMEYLEELEYEYRPEPNGEAWYRAKDVWACIDKEHAVDPASLRPKGEWVEKKEWHHGRWVAWYECSRCGERDDNYEMYEMMPFCSLSNFCPNCGCAMEVNDGRG